MDLVVPSDIFSLYHGYMRDVTRFDADVLASLDAQLFPENALNETTIANEIKHGMGWVIEVADEIVAYVLVRDDHQILDILRLGTRADYQKAGFGTELLERVLREDQQAMLTVKKSNRPALRLYLRHGFEIAGHLKENDSWVMVRKATSSAA